MQLKTIIIKKKFNECNSIKSIATKGNTTIDVTARFRIEKNRI